MILNCDVRQFCLMVEKTKGVESHLMCGIVNYKTRKVIEFL